MRILFTTILAFILSIMIGGMAAVQIAEITKAQEEFILAFMSLILVAVVATIAFAVAQARADPSTSIITTGRWSMALLAASAVGLIMWSVFGANSLQESRRDIPLLLGLIAPAFLAIATQWLFVRWRNRAVISK